MLTSVIDQNNAASRSQPPETPHQRPSSTSRKGRELPVKTISIHHPKKIECIQKSKQFRDLKSTDVKISFEGGMVVIAGQDNKSVKLITKKVRKLFAMIKTKRHRVNTSIAALLTMKDNVSFIDSKLDIPNNNVSWGIELLMTEEYLIVYALNEKYADEKIVQIMGCVTDERVSMEESQSAKIQNLIQSNRSRLIASASSDKMHLVIYTTQDIHDEYFSPSITGSKFAKGRNLQPPDPSQSESTSYENNVSTGFGDKGSTPNTFISYPDRQKKSANYVRASKDSYNENGDLKPDYDPVDAKSYQPFIRVPLGLQSSMLKYLEKYESKTLDRICGKYDVTNDGTSEVGLMGRQDNVSSAKQEIYNLAEKLTVMGGFTYAGKPVIGGLVKHNWERLEQDNTCMIMVEPCPKPVLKSGWIAKKDNQLNILYMRGTLNSIEADIVLCPVNKELLPIGLDSIVLMGGLLNIYVLFYIILFQLLFVE